MEYRRKKFRVSLPIFLFSDYQLEYLENEFLDEINFCFLDYSTRLNLKFT